MQVLIVDHQPNRLLDSSRVFRSAGYQILGAATGHECLRTARAKAPDLILLDAALPDTSGIDLAREIKRDLQLAGIYVVLWVTETTPSSIRARALEAGADGCLQRTLPSRELLARIEAMLRHKRAEEAVQAALQQWKDAFDAIQDAVYLVDTDYRISKCNVALAKLLGKPPSEIIGQHCYELVHGTAEPIPTCLQQRAHETRQRETLVVPMRDRWLDITVDPLFDDNDKLIGTVHVLSDITERRRDESALPQSHAELQKEAQDTGIALERTTEQLHTEAEARHLAEEALSQAHTKLEKQAYEHLAMLDKIQGALQAQTAQREQFEQKLAQSQEALQAESEARQQVEEAVKQARVEREEQAQDYAASLTKAHEELQSLRAALGNVADLIYRWDLESGQMEFFSDDAAKLYHDPSVFPRTAQDFQQAIHPQDRARVLAALQEHLASGEPFSAQCRMLNSEGQVSHWAASGTALQDSGGRPQKWIGVAREISAELQAQKEQRMEAVARLAEGLAQQFNELLGIILGSAELGLAQVEPSYPAYSELAAIQRTARRAAELTRQLSTIHRRQLAHSQVLDLNGLTTALRQVLRRLSGDGIDLELNLAPGLEPVLGDASALEHMLMNLAQNAQAAMPEGGVLLIQTEQVTVDDAHRQLHPEACVGQYVRLSVADSGAGVDQATQEHLFEPFFLTTEADPGTGLHLAEVYGIVRQHGGWIEVRSQPGEGTTFDVYLPIHKPADE